MVFFFKRIININGEFKLCENQQYLYILVLELPNNTLNTYPIYSKGYIYVSNNACNSTNWKTSLTSQKWTTHYTNVPAAWNE